MAQRTYTNWGSFPKVTGEVLDWSSNTLPSAHPITPRGNGRSYGDASLGEHMVSVLPHQGIIAFDEEAATITCKGGTLLADILKVIIPKGFFLPVVPGTKYVSVGGAIACDIHGKNHEKDGTFGDHVLEMTLQNADGSEKTITPESDPTWFAMTCGGMGLTGIVLTTKIQLIRISSLEVRTETITTSLLTEELGQPFLENTSKYSVGWIDALNSDGDFWPIVYSFGEHVVEENPAFPLAYRPPKPKNVPFYMPHFLLSQGRMRFYNKRHYKKSIATASHIGLEPYFWPLDHLDNWNRIYGRNGFIQYQLVVPDNSGTAGLRAIFHKILKAPIPPYLIVFKRFGAGHPERPLSFPIEGYTLAIDLKMHPDLLPFLDELDQMIIEMSGRVYLGKDARMSPESFNQMYPDIEQFKAFIQKEQGEKFSSALSDRLGLTGK